MNSENCPCKRTKCERHGDCEACRIHHHTDKRKALTACERLEEKKNGEKEEVADKNQNLK